MIVKNIGFVSTRFAGTDGVTLEASKWAEIMEKNGHRCFWFAGELEREPKKSFLVPEAHFQHERNRWINERIFGTEGREPAVTKLIHDLNRIPMSAIEEIYSIYELKKLFKNLSR